MRGPAVAETARFPPSSPSARRGVFFASRGAFVPPYGGEIAQSCSVVVSQWLRDRAGAVNGTFFVPLEGSCLNREGRINPSTDVIFLLIAVTLRFTV